MSQTKQSVWITVLHARGGADVRQVSGYPGADGAERAAEVPLSHAALVFSDLRAGQQPCGSRALQSRRRGTAALRHPEQIHAGPAAHRILRPADRHPPEQLRHRTPHDELRVHRAHDARDQEHHALPRREEEARAAGDRPEHLSAAAHALLLAQLRERRRVPAQPRVPAGDAEEPHHGDADGGGAGGKLTRARPRRRQHRVPIRPAH